MQSNQTILKQIDGHVAHKNDKVILPIMFPKSLYKYLDFCIWLLILVNGSKTSQIC